MTEATVCGRCGARSWVGATFCATCGQALTSGGPAAFSPGQTPMPAPVQPTATATAAPQFAPPPFGPPPYGPPPSTTPVAPVPAAQPSAWPPIAGAQYPGQVAPYGAPPAGPWYGAPPAPPAGPWSGAPAPYGAPPVGFNPANLYETNGPRPLGISVLAVVEIITGIVCLYVTLEFFAWANWAANWGSDGELVADAVLGFAYLATGVSMFGAGREIWLMRHWIWMRACLLSVALMGLILVAIAIWRVVNPSDVVGLVVSACVLGYLNTNPVRRVFGRSPLGV